MTDDEKDREKNRFIDGGDGIVRSSSLVTGAERKRAAAFSKRIQTILTLKAAKR